MNRNLVILIIVGVIVIVFLLLTLTSDENEQPENGQEEISEVTEGVTVQNLKLNGEDGTVMLTTDDPSVITATIVNDSEEEQEVQLTLSVRKDGELFDNRHDWTYTVAPGETKEIEEVRETHHTWYPGEFTVEMGDEVITVIVE